MKAPKPMIDRYRWYEALGIYAGMIIFLGFVLAWLYARTGNLLASVTAHALFNLALAV